MYPDVLHVSFVPRAGRVLLHHRAGGSHYIPSMVGDIPMFYQSVMTSASLGTNRGNFLGPLFKDPKQQIPVRWVGLGEVVLQSVAIHWEYMYMYIYKCSHLSLATSRVSK